MLMLCLLILGWCFTVPIGLCYCLFPWNSATSRCARFCVCVSVRRAGVPDSARLNGSLRMACPRAVASCFGHAFECEWQYCGMPDAQMCQGPLAMRRRGHVHLVSHRQRDCCSGGGVKWFSFCILVEDAAQADKNRGPCSLTTMFSFVRG